MVFQKKIGWTLGILLVASLFNGLCWAGLIPMWHTPDEQAHFAQVQNMVLDKSEKSSGPWTSKDIIESEKLLGTFRLDGNNSFTYHPEYKIEYSKTVDGLYEKEIESFPIEYRKNFIASESTGYPPLYYGLISGVNKVFWKHGLITRVFVSRVFTALISTLAIYVVYRLAGEIFRDKHLSLLTATMVSFHPMWRFVGSGITSDTMMNLIYPLLIWCFIKFWFYGGKHYWRLIAVYMIGLLVKIQVLLIMPLLLLTLIWTIKDKNKAGSKASVFSRFLLSVFILSTLIVISNYLAPAATLMLFESWGIKELNYFFNIPSFEGFNKNIDFVGYWQTMIGELYRQGFPWYWGVYRWLSLTLPLWIYRVIKLLILVSLTGWVLGIVKYLKSKRNKESRAKNKSWIIILASSVVYGLGLLTWNYFYWVSNGYSFGIQGRYFFPNLPEHMILFLLGWLLLPLKETARRWTVVILGGFMIALNWYSLYFVMASYYDVSSWNTFFMQASQYKPWFFKAPTLLGIIVLGVLSSGWLLWSLIRYNYKNDKII